MMQNTGHPSTSTSDELEEATVMFLNNRTVSITKTAQNKG